MFYTGGCTGFPKGAMLSHANLIVSWPGAPASGLPIGPESCTLHTAPMYHLADLASSGTTWLVGGRHVFVPPFQPAGVLAAIAQHRVTNVLLVPTMLQALVDHPSSPATTSGHQAGTHTSNVRLSVDPGAGPWWGGRTTQLSGDACVADAGCRFLGLLGQSGIRPEGWRVEPRYEEPHLGKEAGCGSSSRDWVHGCDIAGCDGAYRVRLA